MSSKYTKDVLEPLVKESKSYSHIIDKIQNTFGVAVCHRHLKRCIQKYELNVSHFTGVNGKMLNGEYKKKHWSEILILKKEYRRVSHNRLKKSLLEFGHPYKCNKCENPGIWLGKPLTLEIDHINSVYYDNRPENLQFLCSNCHTQKTKLGL